jgi:hypothetical protein
MRARQKDEQQTNCIQQRHEPNVNYGNTQGNRLRLAIQKPRGAHAETEHDGVEAGHHFNSK